MNSIQGQEQRLLQNDEAGEPLVQSGARRAGQQSHHRYHSTATPAYLLPLPYIPLGLAIFIAGTRYFDFRNHGFDVLAGAAVGTLTAWFGFRCYHPSLLSAPRDSWAPRREAHARLLVHNLHEQD